MEYFCPCRADSAPHCCVDPANAPISTSWESRTLDPARYDHTDPDLGICTSLCWHDCHASAVRSFRGALPPPAMRPDLHEDRRAISAGATCRNSSWRVARSRTRRARSPAHTMSQGDAVDATVDCVRVGNRADCPHHLSSLGYVLFIRRLCRRLDMPGSE